MAKSAAQLLYGPVLYIVDSVYKTLQSRGQSDLHIRLGRGVVMHELLHNLGVRHEQNRPDARDYVRCKEYGTVIVLDSDLECLTQGTEYDCTSIMHYSTPFCNSTYFSPTCNVLMDSTANALKGLSPKDVLFVNRLYSCPGFKSRCPGDSPAPSPTPPATPPPSPPTTPQPSPSTKSPPPVPSQP